MTAAVHAIRGRRIGTAVLGGRVQFHVHAAPGDRVEAVAPDGRRLALWPRASSGDAMARLQFDMSAAAADEYARGAEWSQ